MCLFFGRLAKELLEHESINLPQIMKVLGERPYPLKESIREYLEELEKRKVEEERNKEIEAAEAAMNATTEDSAQEEGVKSDDPESKDEEVVDAAKPLEDDAADISSKDSDKNDKK